MARSFEFVAVDAASDEAQWAMGEYFAELDRRFLTGFAAADAVEALAAARLEMTPPSGLFVVVMEGDAVVGCGGVLWIDDRRAEIKRMWISSTVRGNGLGRQLLTRLEDEVAAAGRCEVVLDTNAVLVQAIAMYRSAGYRPIERYNDNPHAELWFSKTLEG